MDTCNYNDWYNENRPIYTELTKVIRDHIKNVKERRFRESKGFCFNNFKGQKTKEFQRKNDSRKQKKRA